MEVDRNDAHDGEDEMIRLVEVCEAEGLEAHANERWLFVPVHFAENGKIRHVTLAMFAEEALQLADTCYGLVRVDMEYQQHAVHQLHHHGVDVVAQRNAETAIVEVPDDLSGLPPE